MVITAIAAALMSIAYADEARSETQINVTIDENAQIARCVQETRFLNATGQTLDSVVFSLGANALRRTSTLPFDAYELSNAYPGGFTPGGVEFYQIMVDGQSAQWAVQGEGEYAIRVECDLAPGESATFEFIFEVLIPRAHGMLGFGEIGYRLSFFYPNIPVYDLENEMFQVMRPGSVSGMLFFEAQDYTVTVDAPETDVVAAGGEVKSRTTENGRTVTEFFLSGGRDIALALSRRVSAYEKDGVTLHTIHRSRATLILEAANRAIGLFTKHLGPSHAHYTIAEVDGEVSYSPHSGVIFLPSELFTLNNTKELERHVVFSIAKQFIGDRQLINIEREPWLSDAVSMYMAMMYYEETYGHARYLSELNDVSLDALRITLPGNYTVNSARGEFDTMQAYNVVVIGRGTAALHEVASLIGQDAMWAVLGKFCGSVDDPVKTIADFAQALNEASGRELDNYLMEMLYTIQDYIQQDIERIE